MIKYNLSIQFVKIYKIYNNVGKLINSEESVWKTKIEKLGNLGISR